MERVIAHAQYRVAEDVDLPAIARQTDGYSGADLAGLLSSASTDAIQELVASLTPVTQGDGTEGTGGLAMVAQGCITHRDPKGKRSAVGPTDAVSLATSSLQLSAFRGTERISLSPPERAQLLQQSQLAHALSGKGKATISQSTDQPSTTQKVGREPSINTDVGACLHACTDHVLTPCSFNNGTLPSPQVTLYQRHLLSSLSASRPSMSQTDKQRLDHRCREFRVPATRPPPGSRACLA